MFEVAVGRIMAATRQNGGRSVRTRGTNAGGTATVNVPEITSSARVIVVSARSRKDRLAHGNAGAEMAQWLKDVAAISTAIRVTACPTAAVTDNVLLPTPIFEHAV